MITIYGHPCEKFGDGFDLQVEFASEAIRPLCAVIHESEA